MSIEIRPDDLDGPEVVALLREHLEEMHAITPPGSVHALDLSGLQAPNITFWAAWEGSELVGCGALKELAADSGEIKSMRTAKGHRGKGVGARMVEHILLEANRRSYRTLSLETGATSEFAPARALYARFGFEECGPFGAYQEDPNSVFMTKVL